ncbi:MAG: tRNA (adenosine(37)-N6)-threonylcarbamoyltransferase complex dimerization subunit type 1 TsaB [Cyanophyceae cyanobacterium]
MSSDPHYGLALHTTSPQLGLALSNFAGDTRAQTWEVGRELSTCLHLHLKEFLAPQTWRHLKFVAVAKGPGGFTSTRIGIVTARTLAQQLNVPLFAISSLAVIAWSPASTTPTAIEMTARRGQLFVGIYQTSPDGTGLVECLSDRTLNPDAWQQTLDTLPNYRLIKAPVGLGNTAPSLLELAHWQWHQGQRPHWSHALPFYGFQPVDN